MRRLSGVQRKHLERLRGVQKVMRGVIPTDWQFWDTVPPKTKRALLQKGALVEVAGGYSVRERKER